MPYMNSSCKAIPPKLRQYVREQRKDALLDSIGKHAGTVRDQLLKLKPKLILPGGISLQLG